MSKTAIVLGATGLVGSHIVKQLANDERIRKVTSITRRPVSYGSEKIENIVVNFERLTDFKEAFKGDILFSCLGTTLKQAGSMSEQRIVDVDYQLHAAQLATEQGVSDYVLISSSGANAQSLSPYLKMKGELETSINTLSFEHITILQPSLLLGKRASSRTAEGIGSLVLPLLCKLPGLGRYKPIHGSQVATKMIEVSLQNNKKIQTLALDDVFPVS
jgi:uncharacterized protein YbjT (DUF2867 family)